MGRVVRSRGLISGSRWVAVRAGNSGRRRPVCTDTVGEKASLCADYWLPRARIHCLENRRPKGLLGSNPRPSAVARTRTYRISPDRGARGSTPFVTPSSPFSVLAPSLPKLPNPLKLLCSTFQRPVLTLAWSCGIMLFCSGMRHNRMAVRVRSARGAMPGFLIPSQSSARLSHHSANAAAVHGNSAVERTDDPDDRALYRAASRHSEPPPL